MARLVVERYTFDTTDIELPDVFAAAAALRGIGAATSELLRQRFLPSRLDLVLSGRAAPSREQRADPPSDGTPHLRAIRLSQGLYRVGASLPGGVRDRPNNLCGASYLVHTRSDGATLTSSNRLHVIEFPIDSGERGQMEPTPIIALEGLALALNNLASEGSGRAHELLAS